MLPVDAYGGMEGGSKGQEGKNSLSAILTGIHNRMGKKVGEKSTRSYTPTCTIPPPKWGVCTYAQCLASHMTAQYATKS